MNVGTTYFKYMYVIKYLKKNIICYSNELTYYLIIDVYTYNDIY